MLEGNKLGSDGVRDLCDRIMDNNTLLSLNLANCNLRRPGGYAVAQYIKKNPRVETLDLKKNGLKSYVIMCISEAFL